MLSRNADPTCNAVSGNSGLKVSKMNCNVEIDLLTSRKIWKVPAGF